MLFIRKFEYVPLTGMLAILLILHIHSISLAQGDTWTYKTPMPTGRGFTSGAVVDGKIYVVGGFPTHYSVTTAVEMYDPTADTWTRMSNMPSGRCGHATCTYYGKIYVFGGVSPDGYSSATNNVYVYDPQTDTWTQKADMPYANAFCGIAVVNEIIYLIGGTPKLFSSPISTVIAYDPVTESWTQKADMPTARYSLSACVVDGKIYTFGGTDQNIQTYAYKSVEVYDPSTNTWTRKTDMLTGLFGLGTCAMNGKIYAVGGVTNGLVVVTTNKMYDPVTDTWATKSPLQVRRQTYVLDSVGDRIYAIGGSYPDPQNPSEPVVLSSVEEYNTGPTNVEGTLEWEEITSRALEGNLLGDPATRRFAVYLPPSYESSEKQYPSFYMLHGFGESAGSHTGMRYTIDGMIRDGEIGEMIAVFVDGTNRLGGAEYFSSVTLGDYETYITRDLVNYVDAHYRTIPDRNSRGITGYSRGGESSMHLALKFPDVFGAVVAQAGIYDIAIFATPQVLTSAGARSWFAAALPNPDNPPYFFDLPYELVNSQVQIIPELFQKCVELDVMHDVDRYLNQPVRLNGIKIVHGTADSDVPIAQARGLDKKLTDLGIDHVYVEHSGGHVFIAEESLSFLSDYLLSTTAVDEGSGVTAVPLGYALSQNYPNPFNPQTTVRYDLPEPGAVRLSVYNVLGQMVRRLVDGRRFSGTYSVIWDGRDRSGRDVASGVYLYRLKVEGQSVQTRRMVLLR